MLLARSEKRTLPSHIECVDLLCQHQQADLNCRKPPTGDTALHVLAKARYSSNLIATALIKNGLDPGKENSEGKVAEDYVSKKPNSLDGLFAPLL